MKDTPSVLSLIERCKAIATHPLAAPVCDDCEVAVDLAQDPDAVLADPWGQPTGSILCDNCRESRWYDQQVKLMEET